MASGAAASAGHVLTLVRLGVVALVIGLILGLSLASEPPVVRVQVRPAMCLGPCDWLIEVRVERHPDNRYLVLVWQDGDGGSSWIPLDGETAPFLITRRVRGVAPGEYRVLATVLSATAVRGQAIANALIEG